MQKTPRYREGEKGAAQHARNAQEESAGAERHESDKGCRAGNAEQSQRDAASCANPNQLQAADDIIQLVDDL